MSKRFWCEMAWLGGAAVNSGVVLEVNGDRISALTSGVLSPPAGSRCLRGLTIPALANAHSHAFHRALRGRTHNAAGTFWTWRDLMYRTAASLDPDNYYRLARATFAEMALAGIGVVGEFHYLHHQPCGRPYANANAMGSAVVAAAQDAGIRLTLLDTLYLHGGIDPRTTDARTRTTDGYLPLSPDQARFSDGDVESWAGRVEELVSAVSSSTVRVGAAVHSVRAVEPTSIATVAAWTRRHDAPLHVHASEQPAENQQCIALHGASPVEVILEAAGATENLTLVHATHASDHDVALLAEAGAGCCLCPTTERDLADGVGPAATLAGAGVGLCVGSDSHAVVDILEEARAVELDQRTSTLKRGVFGVDTLATMATSAGYRALGWEDGGTLAPGSLADFATVSLDSVRLAGTDPDHPLAAVIYAATSADVTHLVVAGRTVVVDRTHTRVDVEAELSAAVTAVAAS
ncbi:MAG: formimidoylglutamate deiminase [Acidimicrobiaceae bacterium]|nr:formimidoylglutamate deiminase [Acidimicrobiia bacterium]MCY4495428.1 formimidoylglutamate deiminase [Acidimicrobiaceae bacterium]